MTQHRGSGKAAGGLLAAAVATVGVLASLGAGYTVADSALSDSSAYVAKGNAVAHINGESRQPDAVTKVFVKSGDSTSVVRLGDKVAVVVSKVHADGTFDTVEGNAGPNTDGRGARAAQRARRPLLLLDGDQVTVRQ